MKTLIINGSPRKNGDTIALISEMEEYLDGEKKVVYTYYDDISPCIDCRYCWENEGCSIEDRMQEVYKQLNEVDNVILASPLYFSELTGKLLSFTSRFQRFYVSRFIRKDTNFNLKNKNGVIILTGGGDGIYKPALERAKIILGHINVDLIGKVLSLKTNDIPAREDNEALSKARKLALRLNEFTKDN